MSVSVGGAAVRSTARPAIVVLTESELRQCAGLDQAALAAVETGFAQLSGRCARNQILVIKFPDRRGQVDIKTAPVDGIDRFAVKVATGFYENVRDGLPNASGLMAVISTHTGFPHAILLDNGYLTALRTALAGAVAAKYLARQRISVVGVIGAGLQARFQVRALQLVRSFDQVFVYTRRHAEAERYSQEMSAELRLPVKVADLGEVVERSDLLVTTTPSTRSIVSAAWLHPGLHITAMGADTDDKQELDPDVIGRADVVCCDDRAQCARIGELHHALTAGTLRNADNVRELGELVLGLAPGRRASDDITVCDLTGVGVQDTAIALLATDRAASAGLGHSFVP